MDRYISERPEYRWLMIVGNRTIPIKRMNTFVQKGINRYYIDRCIDIIDILITDRYYIDRWIGRYIDKLMDNRGILQHFWFFLQIFLMSRETSAFGYKAHNRKCKSKVLVSHLVNNFFLVCGVDEFMCDGGLCISDIYYCDGHYDCSGSEFQVLFFLFDFDNY